MSNIIKEIEAEQLKATVDQFEVGDTVKVYGKIKEGNRESCLLYTSVPRFLYPAKGYGDLIAFLY